ncbi:MAG: DinB family protein [Acidobacteriota bacterium]
MSELLDLLERYRRGAELLAMASTGAAGPVLDFKVEGHRWTVRQTVCHLADMEAVNAVRFRQVIAEDKPVIGHVDDAAWAEKLDYGKRKLSVALETVRRLRADNHDLLKDLPEGAFTRTTSDSISLASLVEQAAVHLEDQVREMQAVRAVYKEFRAKELAAQSS